MPPFWTLEKKKAPYAWPAVFSKTGLHAQIATQDTEYRARWLAFCAYHHWLEALWLRHVVDWSQGCIFMHRMKCCNGQPFKYILCAASLKSPCLLAQVNGLDVRGRPLVAQTQATIAETISAPQQTNLLSFIICLSALASYSYGSRAETSRMA